jgi:hypothetical protein
MDPRRTIAADESLAAVGSHGVSPYDLEPDLKLAQARPLVPAWNSISIKMKFSVASTKATSVSKK